MAIDTSVDQLVEELYVESGYETALIAEGPEGRERRENVSELIRSAEETVFEDGGEIGLRPLDHFLQRATLSSATDKLAADADAVTLMSVHTAKGLEYGFVAVTGLEDKLFPLARSIDVPEELEEERRLLYVAITRAERELVLSWANQRRREGRIQESVRSRFLRNVADSHCELRSTVRLRSTPRFAASRTEHSKWSDESGFGGASTVAWSPRGGESVRSIIADEEFSQDLARHVVGERVVHRTLGSGTIAEIRGTGRDAYAAVEFDDESVGRKLLQIRTAGLSKGFD